MPKVQKKKTRPSKGKAKIPKKIHIDGMLDDEWNYDFDNGINSDEEHVGFIQWCATLSFHGVGFNHGGDLDTNLDHDINALDVGFDHGATLDDGVDDGAGLNDGVDDGAGLNDGLDHDIALDDGLDHGVVPSKLEDDLWNVDNPKLSIPNSIHHSKFKPRFVTPQSFR